MKHWEEKLPGITYDVKLCEQHCIGLYEDLGFVLITDVVLFVECFKDFFTFFGW